MQLGGDLIVAVNGVPAGDTAKVVQALRVLKADELIRYDWLRGGQPSYVEVPIPAGLGVPSLARPKK